jgi:hypothetical protein
VEGQKRSLSWGELCICFDEDFNMDEISLILGERPYQAQRQAETRINPFSQQHNPGYWEYRTSERSAAYCDAAMLQIYDFMFRHKSELLQILRDYATSGIYIRFWTQVSDVDDFEGDRLQPHFLALASELNATIDIGVESI